MLYIDLHQDLASARMHEKLAHQTNPDLLKKVNAKVVLGTGFTLPQERIEYVLARDLAWYRGVCAHDPEWRMISTARDLKEVLAQDHVHGFLPHVEGMPGAPEDLRVLDDWVAAGIRSIGMVWNDDTPLGGGTKSTAGLTELGRAYLARMEEHSILVDLAHMNRVMFADVMAELTRPPFISHGGSAALVPHERNYTDAQLREVAERGGVIGIYLSQSTMVQGGAFILSDITEHIRHISDVAGEDAVALGTDFGGVLSGLPEGISSVGDIEKLWDALSAEGISQRQIEKIAYANAARYLCENLPE